MWILRRPAESNFVYCIPVGRDFTIGRIGKFKDGRDVDCVCLLLVFLECSLTITDDKSVSRKHASISLPSANQTPLISDCGSKFGTFVDGNAVKTERALRNGDTVKFGGAESEFVVEHKDFTVFISKKCREANLIESLASNFGIPVVLDAIKSNYFVLNDDFAGELDSDLAIALLQAKCIVSPSYFIQLQPIQSQQCNSTFSLALMQPTVVPKMYPLDCWIPQKNRLPTFRSVFEGIRRFIVLETETENTKSVMKRIGGSIGGIETKVIRLDDLLNGTDLSFTELLILTGRMQVKVNSSIRTVSFSSILAALINCDSQLVDINTIHPSKPANANEVVKEVTGTQTPIMQVPITHVPIIQAGVQAPIIQPPSVTYSEPLDTTDYVGPSLTALLPIPVSFLRSNAPITATAPQPHSKTKFVKCHPKHRQPGTIPALIGPDQLQTLNRPASTAISPTTNNSSTRRRVLVKDSWLTEDDFVSEYPKSRGSRDANDAGSMTVKLNSSLKENTITVKDQSIVKHQPNTISPSAPTTTTIPTPTAIPTTTKFQSAFFKNLTKGK